MTAETPASESREPGSAAEPAAPVLLQVRPRKITILASIAAFLMVAAMVVIGLLLLDSDEGVKFRATDQIGLIGVGLLMGGVIMTAERLKLVRRLERVDRNGLWIRNVLGEGFTPWALVDRLSYPQGAPWAQLMMPDDEVKPVMAIQAMDRGRALQALEQFRELQAKYGPPPHTPKLRLTPEDDEQRPLGRLEIIDRQKAAARERDLKAKQEKHASRDAGRRRSSS